MKARKLIISLLALVIIFPQVTFAKDYSDYPQKFWDVDKSHWAYSYISELTDKNVINGYDDGSFKPEHTVSRAEWAKMMVTAAGLNTSNSYNYSISDVSKDHWAYNYIATSKDYMNWYNTSDGLQFRPNQAVSREDVTVSLVKLKGYDLGEVDYSVLSEFKDNDSITNDCKRYVAVAIQKDLINGFEDGTFRGQDTLTRAEASILLCKAFSTGNDNKIVEGDKILTSGTSSNNTKSDTDVQPEVKPTVKPEEPKSEYKVETLLKTDVYTPVQALTQHEDDIYYINTEANSIEKLNMKTQSVKTVFDIDDEFYFDGSYYTVYAVRNIFYDEYRNALVLNANIKSLDILNNSTKQKDVLIDTSKSEVFQYSRDGIDNNLCTYHNILSCDKNGDIWAFSTFYNALYQYFGLDYDTFHHDRDNQEDNRWQYWGRGTNIYSDLIIGWEHYFIGQNGVFKGTPNNELNQIVSLQSKSCIGGNSNGFCIINNEYLVFTDIDGNIEKHIQLSDIDITDETYLVFNNMIGKLFISSNGDVVFYDTARKAFRMISEN